MYVARRSYIYMSPSLSLVKTLYYVILGVDDWLFFEGKYRNCHVDYTS